MCLPGVEEAGWVVVDPGDPSPSTTGSRRGDTVNPQSTYICRVQSCVWRLPKYWPPPSPNPLSTQRVCPPPAPKAGGIHSPGGEGGGSIFWKTPDIGLASHSIISLRCKPTNSNRKWSLPVSFGEWKMTVKLPSHELLDLIFFYL
jgi:hypothetical protein